MPDTAEPTPDPPAGGFVAPSAVVPPDAEKQPLAHAIHCLRQELRHLESLVGPELTGGARSFEQAAVSHLRPAWQRATAGENRLPVVGVVSIAIALQVFLPSRLTFKPEWLLPGLEIALLIGLTAANPVRLNRTSKVLRLASLSLIAAITVANAWSSAYLVKGLIEGTSETSAGQLLANGAIIYFTNIIVFALWYWDWDRGGPVARANAEKPYPDFLFPQMASPEVSPPDWEPSFIDYFYVSFTNATAFSPTDTMPMTRWAKMLMLVQSAVALTTVALVVARAVNILK